MKSLMPQIDSNDGLFHNGNPATGKQGTRVTDTWLNNLQDRVRDVQAEAHYVLQKAGFQPVENKQTQLYEAIVKIIDDNRKTASLTQKGETQLYTGYDSQSENLALTPKTAYQLKQLIDSNTRALGNVIPNSKKSSAVDSNSEDTVANSKAAKTAYDKGVEAKTAAENAQHTANEGVSKANEANNNANGRVSKSGDTMTGSLAITGSQSGGFANGLILKNKAGGQNTSVFVDFYQSGNFPRASMWMRDAGNNSTQIEFLNTPEGANFYTDSRQNVLTITSSGNLWSKAYGWLHDYFHHAGKDYVQVTGSEHHGGLNILKPDGKNMRFERQNNAFKFWAQDAYEIFIPEKSGTVILDNDFTYQKIGDFEIRRYPDGTMIQTFRFNPPGNRVGAQDRKFTFNWAAAFVEKPKIWIQHQNQEKSGFGSLDMTMNTVESETTNTKVTFWVWEWYYNNNLISFDFLAIGRWK